MRKIIVQTINAEKPATVLYGTVNSVSPLKIKIDEKTIIPQSQLQLTRAVTDYQTSISINGGEKQPCIVYNGLQQDEGVTLIRVPGGQRFLIIDHTGGFSAGGSSGGNGSGQAEIGRAHV